MLTLYRRAGEVVLLILPDGRHVEISMQCDARINIAAPPDIVIRRREVHERLVESEAIRPAQ